MSPYLQYNKNSSFQKAYVSFVNKTQSSLNSDRILALVRNQDKVSPQDRCLCDFVYLSRRHRRIVICLNANYYFNNCAPRNLRLSRINMGLYGQVVFGITRGQIAAIKILSSHSVNRRSTIKCIIGPSIIKRNYGALVLFERLRVAHQQGTKK